MTNYEQQAANFLVATGTSFSATFKKNDFYFPTDKETRNIYTIVLNNAQHRYRFTFGQSISASQKNTDPTPYDVLSCLEKNEVGSFEDFCDNYGYESDSRAAFKIYKAVKKESKNVEKLFTPAQIELLQEIQ